MTQLVNFSSQQDFPSNTGNTLFIIHWNEYAVNIVDYTGTIK